MKSNQALVHIPTFSVLLLHPFSPCDELSMRETIMHILASTKSILEGISTMVHLTPLTVLQPLSDPELMGLDQIYERQSDIVNVAKRVTDRFISAHRHKWNWTKHYNWGKVLEVLHQFMKGVVDAKTEIAR